MKAIRYLIGVSIVLVIAVLIYIQQQPKPAEERILGGNIGGDFTLESINGPVSLSDYRGQAVVLYIGYTYCPDICPMALSVLGQALRHLPEEESQQIQGIFVSVDPERDTLEHLANYSAFFSPQIVGVTGEKADIDEVVQQYGAFYRRVEMRDSAMEYAVDHSSRLYLIDKNGDLAAMVSHSTSPDQLMRQLKELIE